MTITDLYSKTPEAGANRPQRYNLIVRVTHWLMALCFLFMWISGYVMRNLMEPDSPLQEYVYDLHKSVGVTLLALVVVRLAVRFVTPRPLLPEKMKPVERRAARFGHAGLYAITVLALTTGWALTDFGGHGVTWFGLAMPQVLAVRDHILGIVLDPLTSDIHAWLVYGLLALVAIHVAAVIKHRVKDGIDLLPRMALRLPRARRLAPSASKAPDRF